ILDKLTREPLTGATIQIAGTTQGAVADLDGNFVWTDLARGTYTLIVKYVGYKDIKLTGLKVDRTELTLTIEMESDAQALGEVSVTAQAKRNTEASLVNEQRRSLVVQSGVSAQQIARTQDKDASEVIRRVPGVSIIDEKFVMVRGLSQRYNNVWMNGSAVPSSEADTRAFSFDILPSSQLDNMVIVKSPAPEYPADFTGGFILISTKSMPSENLFNVSIGTSLNDQTHLKDFLYNKGSKTDFLGFDNGLRSLQAGMKGVLNTHSGNDRRMDLLNNGLNNDWTIHQRRPLADLKLNLNYAHRWEMESGRRAGMLASISYSNTYKTYLNMENSLFGSYDTTHDHSVYLRRSTDDQYNQDVRLGVLLNLMYQPKNSRHHYEFKNLFNQTGKSRYTSRNGFDAQSNDEQSMEYYYSSRSTYNGQFTGKHTSDNGQLDWSTGYSYANRNLPDRRRILLNDSQETGVIALATGNDISREFTRLEEHIGSAGVNYRHRFQFGSLAPSLKAGAYAEYRTRDYHTRQFCYGWGNEMPAGFNRWDVTTEILQDSNYGIEKLYLYEQVRKTYDYSGNQWLAAGYAGVNLPVSNRLGMYAGVRYEYSRMELVRNTRDEEESPRSLFYTHRDWFPSVNAAYQLSEKQQLRLSYGQSVNRPEFREVSTSV
ncbi:MAG: TonB-dependent receptor, partial [Bilophila sp.]